MTKQTPGNARPGGRNARWTIAILPALFVAAVRWLTAAHVNIGAWAAGVPTSAGGYLFIAIAIALLIAPEISRISFGGFRLEMLRDTRDEVRDTRDEVRQVRDSIHQLQLQVTENSAKAIAQNVKRQKNVYKTGQATADLAGGLEKGEEAKPVPAAEVLRVLKASNRGQTPGSAGRTVKE